MATKKAQKVPSKKPVKKAPTKPTTKKAPVKKDTQKVSLKKAVKNEKKPKAKAKKIQAPTTVTLSLTELTMLLVSATVAGRESANASNVSVEVKSPAQEGQVETGPITDSMMTRTQETISPDDF